MFDKIKELAEWAFPFIRTPQVARPRNADARAKLKTRHEECSLNLRNSVLTFAGFAAVCWATLSKTDIELLASQSLVTIPIAQIDVSLDKFLTVAPYIALMLVAHSAVFRLRLNSLDPLVPYEDRLSTLFNLPGAIPKFATFFLHVVIPSALIFLFLAKTRIYSDSALDIFILCVSLIFVALPNINWREKFKYENKSDLLLLLLSFYFFIFLPTSILLRDFPPNYSDADFTDLKTLTHLKKVMGLEDAIFSNAIFTGLDLGSHLGLGRRALVGSDFTSAKLSGVQFTNTSFKGVTFTNAHMNGANYTSSVFIDSDLSQANLTQANFTDTVLSSTSHIFGLDMREVVLEEADLTGINFTRANLTGANLKQAFLKVANLTDATLTDADMKNAYLAGANLTGAILEGTNLTGATLAGADMKGADMNGADLTDASLTWAVLKNETLTRANLTGADLTGANLTRAILKGTNLTGATLAGADLKDADLSSAILKGTNLTGATLAGADLKDADLSSAILTDCDLREAKNLTQAQLATVQFDPEDPPLLPDGLTLPP